MAGDHAARRALGALALCALPLSAVSTTVTFTWFDFGYDDPFLRVFVGYVVPVVLHLMLAGAVWETHDRATRRTAWSAVVVFGGYLALATSWVTYTHFSGQVLVVLVYLAQNLLGPAVLLCWVKEVHAKPVAKGAPAVRPKVELS